jgi:predicted DNA binding CopG/RHH family protein
MTGRVAGFDWDDGNWPKCGRHGASRAESKSHEKKRPVLTSDEEAERFVEEADLTGYDFSEMVPMPFEFEPKTAQINMRVPQTLLDAVKERAKRRGIPYTRFIRELMEREVSRPEP